MNYMKGIALAFAAALTQAACGGGSSTGGLDAEATYTIALTSTEEVPAPKPTQATGTAQVVVFANDIEFQLSARNITGITMAHIHNGAVGIAGPIVVTLFMPAAPTGSVDGVFASGRITAASLTGGVTIESLKALLASGSAYINVHTTANMTGEIRGQLR
jgi:hypothetical protein